MGELYHHVCVQGAQPFSHALMAVLLPLPPASWLYAISSRGLYTRWVNYIDDGAASHIMSRRCIGEEAGVAPLN
jgi:hypothetical protein